MVGARPVALAAACAALGEEDLFPARAAEVAPGWPLEFWSERGPSGYVLQSVPAALCCWLRHPRDYRAAVTEAITLGGDADTVAAIVGGIVGFSDPPPEEWIDSLWEPVPGPRYLRHLAQGARSGAPDSVQLPRNLLFLGIVLAHGFRRLLP